MGVVPKVTKKQQKSNNSLTNIREKLLSSYLFFTFPLLSGRPRKSLFHYFCVTFIFRGFGLCGTFCPSHILVISTFCLIKSPLDLLCPISISQIAGELNFAIQITPHNRNHIARFGAGRSSEGVRSATNRIYGDARPDSSRSYAPSDPYFRFHQKNSLAVPFLFLVRKKVWHI